MSETSAPPPLGEGPISALFPCQPDASVVDAWRAAVERAAPCSQVLADGESKTPLGESLRRLWPSVANTTVLVVLPDVAHRPGELKTLLDNAKQADVVVGVRQGRPRPRWLERSAWLGRVLAQLLFGVVLESNRPWYGWRYTRRQCRYRWLFGLRLKDPESGLLLIRRELWAQCPTQSNGRFAMIELLAKANFAGAMIVEALLGPPGKAATTALADDPRDMQSVFRRPRFLPPTLGESDEQDPARALRPI